VPVQTLFTSSADMSLHPNSTILEHFIHFMDKGDEKKAQAIERGYNYLEDCFDIDVSFEPIDLEDEED